VERTQRRTKKELRAAKGKHPEGKVVMRAPTVCPFSSPTLQNKKQRKQEVKDQTEQCCSNDIGFLKKPSPADLGGGDSGNSNTIAEEEETMSFAAVAAAAAEHMPLDHHQENGDGHDVPTLLGGDGGWNHATADQFLMSPMQVDDDKEDEEEDDEDEGEEQEEEEEEGGEDDADREVVMLLYL
jgi:hypothetical protein